MRARDLFGVVVRGIGVWMMTQAAYWAFFAVMKSNPSFGNPRVPQQEDVAMAVFYVALGLVLLGLADPIVRLIYGPQIRTPLGADEPNTL